jgi:hypothetical protein
MYVTEEFKVWLNSLDAEADWNYEDLEELETQIVDCIQASGYVNLNTLLQVFSRC